MRTLPLLSLILLLILVAVNGFFAYQLFLKDKLAERALYSPEAYLGRGLQVIFEPKGKTTPLPPPLPRPVKPAGPEVAKATEASFTTKATTTPPAGATPAPAQAPAPVPKPPSAVAVIKQALGDLRVAANQFYIATGSYGSVCAGGLINDGANDDLARVVGTILASRGLSSQFEAGVSCQTAPGSYQVSVSLPDGSAWCVSNTQAGYVCAP